MLVATEHGLQEMKGAEPVVQEYTTPLFKSRCPPCKLIQPRQIRRVQSTILEETHVRHEPRYFRSSRIWRAGLPTTTVRGGTSRLTTAPAPTTAPSPIVTPFRMMTLKPLQALSPMMTGAWATCDQSFRPLPQSITSFFRCSQSRLLES